MSLEHIIQRTAARKAQQSTPSISTAPPSPLIPDCIYRGESPGGTIPCNTCRGRVELKLYSCKVYGECTLGKKVDGVASCKNCTSRVTPGGSSVSQSKGEVVRKVKWAYGVTTVPARRSMLLKQTLMSMGGAGFGSPRLFVDDCADPGSWQKEFNLEVTGRFPRIKAYANWVLALIELFAREPTADWYALFQDDVVMYRNLRQYLEKCIFPEKSYLNLYTFPWASTNGRDKGPQAKPPSPDCGWYESNQRGRGALGLVFSNEGVRALLSGKASDFLLRKAMGVDPLGRNIDGGVSEAMRYVGYKEYIHDPSLVQHTGTKSEIGNRAHPLAPTFRGEEFDAMDLLSTHV